MRESHQLALAPTETASLVKRGHPARNFFDRCCSEGVTAETEARGVVEIEWLGLGQKDVRLIRAHCLASSAPKRFRLLLQRFADAFSCLSQPVPHSVWHLCKWQ